MNNLINPQQKNGFRKSPMPTKKEVLEDYSQELAKLNAQVIDVRKGNMVFAQLMKANEMKLQELNAAINALSFSLTNVIKFLLDNKIVNKEAWLKFSDDQRVAYLSEIEKQADENNGLVKVDKPVENGNVVVLKFGAKEKNGDTIVELTQDFLETYIGEDSKDNFAKLMPELQKEVLGLKAGDVKDSIPFTLPEDFALEHLRNVEVFISFTIISVKEFKQGS